MKVEDFEKDHSVIYIPFNMEKTPKAWEYGVVTSKNDKYVFVKFHGDTQSKACYPKTLRRHKPMIITLSDLSEEHVKTLKNALDLYSRILCGQITELVKVRTVTDPESTIMTKDWIRRHRDAEYYLSEAKARLFPKLAKDTNYGIHSEDVPDSARVAYDMYQVLAHSLYLLENSESDSMNVDADEPLQSSKTTELASVRIE